MADYSLKKIDFFRNCAQIKNLFRFCVNLLNLKKFSSFFRNQKRFLTRAQFRKKPIFLECNFASIWPFAYKRMNIILSLSDDYYRTERQNERRCSTLFRDRIHSKNISLFPSFESSPLCHQTILSLGVPKSFVVFVCNFFKFRRWHMVPQHLDESFSKFR